MVEDHTQVFSFKAMRRARSTSCLAGAGVLGILFIQMEVNATAIVYGYMGVAAAGIAVLLTGAVRAWRIGIYLDDVGVVVRTTYSTRSWKWQELERVGTLDMVSRGGPMGVAAATTQRREPRTIIIPVFRLVGRNPVPVRGLKITTTTPQHANWLDTSLREVNRAIEEHRTAPEAGAASPTPS